MATSRIACVDVPALALQLLLRREPSWRSWPVAVVDRDEPQGRILQVNGIARRARIRTGRRYAEGLTLSAGLRAGVVDRQTLDEATTEILAALRALSPVVEPAGAGPQENGQRGLFWLDATGLQDTDTLRGLYRNLRGWSEAVHERITALDLHGTVAVASDRFGSYALARTRTRSVLVVEDPAHERRLIDRVSLDALDLPPRLHESLRRLGVTDVGALRALPEGGLLARFGADAGRLHRLLTGRRDEGLAPHIPKEPLRHRFENAPDAQELDLDTLLHEITSALHELLRDTAKRGEALRSLQLVVHFETRRGHTPEPFETRVRPAEPTLAHAQLIDLTHRRLESMHFEAPPIAFELQVEGVPAERAQLELFAEAPGRDLRVASRSLARLRASLGESAVLHARVRDGHLPEARFLLDSMSRLESAKPTNETIRSPRLIRRLHDRPRALSAQRPGPDGWLPLGLQAGPVRHLHGPFVIAGGWWSKRTVTAPEQRREFHYAELERGDLVWLFFDRVRRRWFQSGTVE